MSYTVYGSATNRATRAIWALEEVGAEYEINPVKPHAPELLAVSPMGKLPVLKHNDFVISDSAAIVSYIADQHPQAGLTFPSGTQERGGLESWLFFAQSELEAPIWLETQHAWLIAEDKRCEAIYPFAREKFKRAVDDLALRLGDQQFAMGDQFTIVDILFGHIKRWSTRLDDYPMSAGHLDAYFDRVLARPALERTLATANS